MRGFIDDEPEYKLERYGDGASQSAFVRGFIDDVWLADNDQRMPESQSAFVRGFIDDCRSRWSAPSSSTSLNPRSCAASSMTRLGDARIIAVATSQSAFVRGFIDDAPRGCRSCSSTSSQSAFVRGFIDDAVRRRHPERHGESQSAFVRGFIDD